jgi:glycerol-3-phosphate dehydrogenase
VAEAAFAVRHEAAVEIADVMLRRTVVAWSSADHGRAHVASVADAMAAELGWDGARVAAELDGWRSVARAEGLVPGAAGPPGGGAQDTRAEAA